MKQENSGRYFKLVCTRENKTEWLLNQYLNGKVHFGWSGPNSNLTRINDLPSNEMSKDDKVTWRYTQFLIKRIKIGDRLILQFEQPLRKFLIAQVTGDYGFLDPPEDDFNHYLECDPLVSSYINISSTMVPKHLRYDLTKRGHYYEIYPENSIKQLDLIIAKSLWENAELNKPRETIDDLEDTKRAIVKKAIKTISDNWKGTDFELFITILIESIAGVSVKRAGDSKKGWDLTISIADPITGEILSDDIPVQCKNYYNEVTTDTPINDLKRSIRNSPHANLAYLFIIGDLTKEFKAKVDEEQEILSTELKRDIFFKIVDQYTIAELYISSLREGNVLEGDSDIQPDSFRE